MQSETKADDINNAENMPPASAAHRITTNPDRGSSLTLHLGADYERKKQKLKQELQLDYKQYVAKKEGQKTNEPRPQPQSLSLPIDEKLAVKEKLREERNKEYNIFLQNQAISRRLKRGTPPVTSKPGQVQASEASQTSPLSALNTHIHSPPPHRGHPHRKDAATLTEAVDNGTSRRSWNPGNQRRRHWQLYRPKEPYSSEEELITDTDEELEVGQRRRKNRHSPEPKYKEEWRTRERRANRAPQDTKEVVTPGVHDHNNNVWIWKSDLQKPDSMRVTTRSRPATSRDKAEIATGLMIGTIGEQTASQLRKEQYKQELLKQIAEQQRNKMREKKLEPRVAATGATDPEKEPDRIKQIGRRGISYKPGIDLKARGRDLDPRPKYNIPIEDTEKGGPQGTSQMDSSTALSQLSRGTVPGSEAGAPQGVPSLDYLNEVYHRHVSNVLGEVAIPRVASIPPPIPPAITNNYQTPYDAAYYYYGTRNPLDPHLPQCQNGLPKAVQQPGNIHSHPQRPPALIPSDFNEATDQYKASFLDVGKAPVDKTKQKRESTLNYQEALRQQIEEREEHKKREKEEKELYDAKIEAEMMAYNPWGRSGGGAPIKDEKGNLFSDLNQMHRINEELYRNPVVRNSEARTPRSHRRSGFSDPPTPLQLHMQERYRDALKQQIEENKRKQAEERDKIRTEEEKEEKRLAEQRAHILQEYEKEQMKQKKIEQRMDMQSWIHKPKTHHQEEEKRARQEQKSEIKIPESHKDREETKAQPSYERQQSPPIPALQKKQTHLVVSQPSSVASQFSPRTFQPQEHSVSSPNYQPAPVGKTSLQDDQRDVLRQLSSLRRHLQKEKEESQMKAQWGQTDQQKNHYTPTNWYYSQRPLHTKDQHGRQIQKGFRMLPKGILAGHVAASPTTYRIAHSTGTRRRGRSSANSSELVHKQTDQRPHSGAAHTNMQNIREFNQLKYRDTASREEVLHMYPDPPTNAQSLDIQQQALLREQQRTLRHMKREDHNFLEQQPSHYPRNRPGRFIHRDSVLPTETSFIDIYSGGACEEQVHQQSRQPSAEHQERTVSGRKHDYGQVSQREHNIQPAAHETRIRAHNQQGIGRQDSGTSEPNDRSEGLSGDEVDALSQRSTLERQVSMETVATEPWLRPSTSLSVKHSGSRQRPKVRTGYLPFL